MKALLINFCKFRHSHGTDKEKETRSPYFIYLCFLLQLLLERTLQILSLLRHKAEKD